MKIENGKLTTGVNIIDAQSAQQSLSKINSEIIRQRRLIETLKSTGQAKEVKMELESSSELLKKVEKLLKNALGEYK